MTRWLAPSLVAGFGAYLVYAYGTGVLAFYIHPIYIVPTVLSGIALMAGPLLAALGPAGAVPPSRLSALLWVIPVAVAVLLPARPLGISTAAQRGSTPSRSDGSKTFPSSRSPSGPRR